MISEELCEKVSLEKGKTVKGNMEEDIVEDVTGDVIVKGGNSDIGGMLLRFCGPWRTHNGASPSRGTSSCRQPMMEQGSSKKQGTAVRNHHTLTLTSCIFCCLK